MTDFQNTYKNPIGLLLLKYKTTHMDKTRDNRAVWVDQRDVTRLGCARKSQMFARSQQFKEAFFMYEVSAMSL